MTDHHPDIVFSVSETANRVDQHSELWAVHLPANRHPGDSECSPATVGDYFTAAGRFLSDNDFRIIKSATLDISGKTLETPEIERVEVCLVKHGTFYHPARVSVHCAGGSVIDLALNLAVSPEGLSCIDREYGALDRLGRRSDALPRVYGNGRLTLDNGIESSMFVAGWFDRFHEFHLTRHGDEQKIVVWDGRKEPTFLSASEEEALYEQASYIMTCCYNPDTCEQIQPWHHAAGDFVVRKDDKGGLVVKLITVRQYTSFFEDPPEDEDTVIDAMLIFLINLSMRMRLDREDGIGETLWAAERSVLGTVRGFRRGLDAMCSEGRLGMTVKDRFIALAPTVPESELLEMAGLLIRSYHPQSPDLSVINAHIETHIQALSLALKAWGE